MNQEDNRPPYQPGYPYYQDDEINLIDYLLVMWKWKWLIIGGVLASVIVAAVICFQMPRKYEISMYIEPGIAGIKDDGKFLYIDTPANLSTRISGGIFNVKMGEILSQNQLPNTIEFTPTPVKGSDAIKVTSRWEEEKTDLGRQVSRQLITFLQDDYEKEVQRIKRAYDRKAVTMQNDIARIEDDIKLQKTILNLVRKRKAELLDEIGRTRENREKIEEQRGILMKGEDRSRDLSLLFYLTANQQNLQYVNKLSTQAYEMEDREKTIQAQIVKLSKEIADINAQIDKLNIEKGLVGTIRVIQQPEVSPNPVGTSTKQILLLTGVASLFMFIFCAFLIEYIRNATSQKKTEG